MKTGYVVADVMTENPVTMSSDDTIVECAKKMRDKHVGAIIIKDNGKMSGIITEQDIVRGAIAEEKNPLEMKLTDIMETNVHTIEPDKDIFDAIKKMKDLNIRHLPVIQGKKFLGLLTLKDVLRIEPQLFELLIDKFELREEERKPIPELDGRSGICNICGELTEKLFRKDGVLMCDSCREH